MVDVDIGKFLYYRLEVNIFINFDLNYNGCNSILVIIEVVEVRFVDYNFKED